MKSFSLFWKAVKSTRHEMWVSLQVLIVATLILSLLLYLVEHAAQPNVFRNYWDALLWSFMGYIGDPGEFATYTPVTFWGRVLKIMCAIVNIAIFAVPAGLVAGGFSDAIAEDKREKQLADFKNRLTRAFRRKQDKYTKFRVVPRYISPVDVQALQQLDTKDIIETVRASDNMRLRNLAAARPASDMPVDRLVIEPVPTIGRTSYGCCIDRGSRVTIVAPSSAVEPSIGHFAYYTALYGGFNFISKEFDVDPDEPESYYIVADPGSNAPMRDYMADLRRLTGGTDRWAIFLIASESVYDEQLHFVTAVQPKIAPPASTIIDRAAFDSLYRDVAADMADKFDIHSELDTRYLPAGPKNIARRIDAGKTCNAFTLRVAWSVTAFDNREIAIAHLLAADIARALTPGRSEEPDPVWKENGYGY